MTYGEFPHPRTGGLPNGALWFTMGPCAFNTGFQVWVDYIKNCGGFYDTECVYPTSTGRLVWGDEPRIYQWCNTRFVEDCGVLLSPEPKRLARLISEYLGLTAIHTRAKHCPDYISPAPADFYGDLAPPSGNWWHKVKAYEVKYYPADKIHRFDRHGQSRRM